MSKKQYLDRHGNPIDVYTYPERADHQALRDYQHAVEVAHERDGLPVEFFYAKTMEWQAVVPDFYWDRRKYRIKASKLAEGRRVGGRANERRIRGYLGKKNYGNS